MLRVLDPNSIRGNYISKDKITNEKILLCLPCNGGARKGNYFLGSGKDYSWNSWRATDYFLRGFRNEFYMVAVSSVNFYFNDKNGALVFEHEMDRVSSGEKDYGKANYSIYKKEKLDQEFHKDMVKIGLKRALDYGIERFIFVLNVLFYKFSVYKAVEELNLWDKVTICNVNTMGMMDHWIKMFPIIIENNLVGILNDKRIEFVNSKNEIKLDGYDFWNSGYFKYLDDLKLKLVILDDKHGAYKFKFPILECDVERFVEKYKFLPNWNILDIINFVDIEGKYNKVNMLRKERKEKSQKLLNFFGENE